MPCSILRNDARAASADATLGAPVQVDPDGPPAKASYIIQRGIDVEDREGVVLIRDRAEKSLSPSLFYRGHIYQTTEPIKVVLEPLKEVIYVRLAARSPDHPKGLPGPVPFAPRRRIHAL